MSQESQVWEPGALRLGDGLYFVFLSSWSEGMGRVCCETAPEKALAKREGQGGTDH